MFKKILVPLDRSELAEEAIGRAVALARHAHAMLDLVLVHEPLPFVAPDPEPWTREYWKQDLKYLEATAKEITSGSSVPVTYAVLDGEPEAMIARRAWEADADLIVLTSHGRTGWSRAWLGSVADGLLRHSAVPVLMLRATEKKRRHADTHGFHHVLVPLDGSSLSSAVLSSACALAACSEAKITLLRIVQPIPQLLPDGAFPYAYPAMIPDEKATHAVVEDVAAQLREVVSSLRDDGVTVEARVVVADHIAAGIIDYARAHECDVIAMSTHGRGASRLAFGSVADKVLRGSGLPMLMFRPLAVAASEKPGAEAVEQKETILTPA